MFKSIVPITKESHKKTKIKPLTNFDFAKEVNLSTIMVHEFSRAASIYPIVFIEDKEKDQFRPTVLLGLEAGENLFIQDGKWNASYIPAILRRYPFALAQTEDKSKYTVCIDDKSDLVNTKEGQPLFNDKGEPGEVMDRVKQYLGELQQMEKFTEDFSTYMKENNMFTPLNMKVKLGDEIKNISGAYVINEERLNSLSDEKFLEMRAKQYISVTYSHLSSLSQIERLLGFKDKSQVTTEAIEDRFSDNKKIN
ncbi:MAG: peptidase [Candidatus Cloacimonadota bacterium]|nr:MAG: peptidase [Candidatus Cloacimonadota bacterium]